MEDQLRLFMEETSWYNDVVLGAVLPEKWWAPLPHFYRGWLRNYIGGTLLYLLSGIFWCLYVYYLKRNVYVPKEEKVIWNKPWRHEMRNNRVEGRSRAIYKFFTFLSLLIFLPAFHYGKHLLVFLIICLGAMIGVAMKAMPWYCALPTISEYMIEHGWTKCFSRISDVGWAPYVCNVAVYLIIVEFGIYWMHRELHDIKPLYKYLHATHHIYNKQNTLSPFAGLAFHPLDGILQAVPHVIALFLVPMHFTTHIALLFIEALWTANIHDCIHGKIWPVMGAGYHTIHHTTYRHNYGHYTIWMDWMFGTLRDPLEDETKKI